MNTAVPGTRGGFFLATSVRKRSIGSDPACRILVNMLRPVFHVLISVKMKVAIAMVTHPPLAILIAFAAKKARSMKRKKTRKAMTVDSGQCQRCRETTLYRMVVIPNAPVTAMP